MKLKHLFLAVMGCIGLTAAAGDSNYAGFNIYESDNAKLKTTYNNGSRVVFIGNSITDIWGTQRAAFFAANGFIGRGIGGQTSYEMLTRFREDVVSLNPAGVVISAGTNDLACNLYSWYNEDRTFGNIASMAEIANANGIKVFLASVLPVTHFLWAPDVTGYKENIVSLNNRIKAYAKDKGFVYIDYYSSLVYGDCDMNPAYAADGVHPNVVAYEIMEGIVLPIIRQYISEPKPYEAPEHLYIVGDAAPAKWNFNAATELTNEGGGKYSYKGALYQGKLIFIDGQSERSLRYVPTQSGSNFLNYRGVQMTAAYNSTSYLSVASAGEYKVDVTIDTNGNFTYRAARLGDIPEGGVQSTSSTGKLAASFHGNDLHATADGAIAVYDVAGNCLSTSDAGNIVIKDLPAGVYIVKTDAETLKLAK